MKKQHTPTGVPAPAVRGARGGRRDRRHRRHLRIRVARRHQQGRRGDRRYASGRVRGPEGPDLNGDGYSDVVFTTTYRAADEDRFLLAVVYGGKDGPDPDNRVLYTAKDLGMDKEPQPTELDDETTVADLDGDGHLDIVVGGSAAVVWGGPDGPRPDSEIGGIKLPHASAYAYEQQPLAGDFDGDGHADLITHRTDSADGEVHSPLVVLHGPFERDGSAAATAERPNPRADGTVDQIGWLTTGDSDGDKATDVVVHDVSDDEDSSSTLLTGGADTDTGLSDSDRPSRRATRSSSATSTATASATWPWATAPSPTTRPRTPSRCGVGRRLLRRGPHEGPPRRGR
ncbi:VCBS repeat-containing protein [Streptomyces sp. M19]